MSQGPASSRVVDILENVTPVVSGRDLNLDVFHWERITSKF